MLVLSIPSPSQAVWEIGPVPIRAYALCIIAGALLAIWIGEARWRNRGGRPHMISDIAVWAIPAGIIGARLYHVITDPQLYFGEGRDPISALYIWNGGLGIWGGVAGGALGAWYACRRYRAPFGAVADVLAPGLLVAQAVGRFGNYFNQELFGRPTDLPWALEIAPENRPAGYGGAETFHPTFLYEALWNLGAAALLVWVIGRRLRFGHGQIFAAYVLLYTAGRFWIEILRIDPVNDFDGIRLNVVTSVVVFALALYVFSSLKRKTEPVDLSATWPDEEPAAAGDGEKTAAGRKGPKAKDSGAPEKPASGRSGADREDD